MSSKKIQFINTSGQTLSARLELPEQKEAHTYAIFAHCFTCNKNFKAVKSISRVLNNFGIGVLRFDFTGLGESEGDFADTTFSSNVQDLLDAGKFLEEHYQAPEILIGHSLGGAAVIFAAAKMSNINAIITIGAPSSPKHVSHLFKTGLPEIKEKGAANVEIGGRTFTLKKEFVEDLQTKDLPATLKELRKPLLIIHSPQDTIVGIENAKELYQAAMHPKSFVSIDKADHLLTDKDDSKYVGNVIAGWVVRYIEVPETKPLTTDHQVAVSIGNEGYTSEVVAGKHLLIADEPEKYDGNDFGPSPYEFISSGLGACTAMTLRMYADRKKWPLEKVIVHVDHGKDHCQDCADVESSEKKIDQFVRKIELFGNLDDKQKQKLLEIAEKCPVHKTLESSSKIRTELMT